jgi:hypothetical protein
MHADKFRSSNCLIPADRWAAAFGEKGDEFSGHKPGGGTDFDGGPGRVGDGGTVVGSEKLTQAVKNFWREVGGR